MLLYSCTGAVAIEDPEYGRFEVQNDGTFDLPDELAERELRFHDRGQPRWETQVGRQQRIASEDLDRRRDPAALLDAVQQILMAAKLAQSASAPAETLPATIPRSRKKSATPPPAAE